MKTKSRNAPIANVVSIRVSGHSRFDPGWKDAVLQRTDLCEVVTAIRDDLPSVMLAYRGRSFFRVSPWEIKVLTPKQALDLYSDIVTSDYDFSETINGEKQLFKAISGILEQNDLRMPV